MRSVPVAADPASQRNVNATCEVCGRCVALEDSRFLDAHLCPSCGSPRSIRGGEDFFQAFGVPRRFRQDRDLLQKRFYELSRALHPDRFAATSAQAKQGSLERMSFVNDAYRTLRDPIALRDYVLKTAGITIGESEMPVELAESWFELQEEVQGELMENPAQARRKLKAFLQELAQTQSRLESEIAGAEEELDREGFSSGLLEKLGRKCKTRNYLISLERNARQMGERMDS